MSAQVPRVVNAPSMRADLRRLRNGIPISKAGLSTTPPSCLMRPCDP